MSVLIQARASLVLGALITVLALSACSNSATSPATSAAPVAQATAEVAATEAPTPTAIVPTSQPSPTQEPTQLPEPTSTATPTTPVEPTEEQPAEQPTPEPTPTSTPTLDIQTEPTPEQPVTETAVSGNTIVIDHTAVERFDAIPDDYIQAASQLSILFRHASVGVNINDGLNCLMNNFDGGRPNYCDRNVPPDQAQYDGKYDRSNWTFEVHNKPNANPGWWNKVNFFIDRINNLSAGETYDFAAFTFGYVDGYPGSAIDDKFFANDPNDSLPSVEDLEALDASVSDMDLIYWTMGLARRSEAETERFNQGMRGFAATNGKILFDLADIESHSPDGSPCFDNAGQDIEAICSDYTDEVNAGHLNAVGRLRLAKAFWVLMARMAGWEG